MSLNTRSKRREPVSTHAEFSILKCGDHCIALNVPKDSVKMGADEVVTSALLDVSAIGCALESPYLLPSGIELSITIDSKPFTAELGQEARPPLAVQGRVRSCVMRPGGKYRLGIQFTKADKEIITIISDFIAAKDRRQAPRWDMTK